MTLVPSLQKFEYEDRWAPIPYRIITTWFFKDPGYFRLGMNFRTKLKRLLRVERLQSVEYQHIENKNRKEKGFIEIVYGGNGNDRVFRYFKKLTHDSSGTMLDLKGEIEGDGVRYEFTIAWLHSMSCNLIDPIRWWQGKKYWYTIRFYIHEELKRT